MTVTIERLEVSDVPAVSAVAEAAFANNPFLHSGLPKDITPEQMDEYRLWRQSVIRGRMAKENTHYFKAVDQASGSLVGYAGLHGPTITSDKGPRYPGKPGFMIGMEDVEEMFKQLKKRVLGDREDVWFLQAMGTHPDWQGKGIAGRLMRTVMEIVDENAGECYLESTPVAKSLYMKSGFELKETIAVLDGTYVLSALLRPRMSEAM